MAHFAKINSNNEVIEVLVVDNNQLITPEGLESEILGQTFLFNLTGHRIWRQTSYNGNFRKNFAGIGYVYDSNKDAFIPPKPYSSWTLNEETCIWEAPVPYPNDGQIYIWNEEQINWVLEV